MAVAYGCEFTAQLSPAEGHPGHYLFVVVSWADGRMEYGTPRVPVTDPAFMQAVAHLLSRLHGLVLGDFAWIERDADALPLDPTAPTGGSS